MSYREFPASTYPAIDALGFAPSQTTRQTGRSSPPPPLDPEERLDELDDESELEDDELLELLELDDDELDELEELDDELLDELLDEDDDLLDELPELELEHHPVS